MKPKHTNDNTITGTSSVIAVSSCSDNEIEIVFLDVGEAIMSFSEWQKII